MRQSLDFSSHPPNNSEAWVLMLPLQRKRVSSEVSGRARSRKAGEQKRCAGTQPIWPRALSLHCPASLGVGFLEGFLAAACGGEDPAAAPSTPASGSDSGSGTEKAPMCHLRGLKHYNTVTFHQNMPPSLGVAPI